MACFEGKNAVFTFNLSREETPSVTTRLRTTLTKSGTDCAVLRAPDAPGASVTRIGEHPLMSCSYNHDCKGQLAAGLSDYLLGSLAAIATRERIETLPTDNRYGCPKPRAFAKRTTPCSRSPCCRDFPVLRYTDRALAAQLNHSRCETVRLCLWARGSHFGGDVPTQWQLESPIRQMSNVPRMVKAVFRTLISVGWTPGQDNFDSLSALDPMK